MESLVWTILAVAWFGAELWHRARSVRGAYADFVSFWTADLFGDRGHRDQIEASFWAGTFLGNVDFGCLIGTILEGCVEAACECGG